MNDLARQKLVKLMDSETQSVLEDPEKFEALLRDFCGDCRQEISALMAALDEEVPHELLRMRNEPYMLLTSRLANKLHEERSIFPEAAQWAVDSWAVALEIAPGSKRVGGAQVGGAGAMGGTITPVGMQPRMQSPQQATWQNSSWSQQTQQSQQGQQPWQGNAVGSQVPVQGWTPPQSFPPGYLPVPAEHNSIVVGVVFLAMAVLMGYFSSTSTPASGMGPVLGIFMVLAGILGVAEILLGVVRNGMKQTPPSALAMNSLNLWMKMFAVEDKVLGIFGKNQGGNLQQGPAMQAPATAPYVSPSKPASVMPVAAPVSLPMAAPLNITPIRAVQPQVASQVIPVQTPQAAGGTVFCVVCGATNEAGAVFCITCGEKLYYPDAAPAASPN